MNKLLIKIPTRERGFDWLRHYLDNITNPHTRILLSIDSDDNFGIWATFAIKHKNIFIQQGKNNGKIEAINRDINRYIDEFDVLLVGSDDMKPLVKGFDQIILDDMAKYFPDGDGCLWYKTEDWESELRRRYRKDIKPGSKDFLTKWICMLPIMGKAYYKRFGYVYHPSYKSFWCDNEQTQVAYNMRKIQYIHREIITHMHPSWNENGVNDSLYTINEKNWNHDRANFHKRKMQGFPIAFDRDSHISSEKSPI